MTWLSNGLDQRERESGREINTQPSTRYILIIPSWYWQIEKRYLDGILSLLNGPFYVILLLLINLSYVQDLCKILMKNVYSSIPPLLIYKKKEKKKNN